MVYAITVFGLICFLSGCNGNAPKDSTADGTAVKSDISSQNVHTGNGKTYRMRILAKPDVIESGKQVVFSFKPEVDGIESQPVPLDANHGYEMNLIMVNSDLTWFDHKHPGLSDLGIYEQPYTFEKGGSYHLYAEYKPTGSKDTFQVKTFAVNGYATKSTIYTESRLTSQTAPYDVTLSPEDGTKFESGNLIKFNAAINKDGMQVAPNSLGDYLGGKGYMVLISVREKEFLPLYPTVENGNLVFQTTLSKPGYYRAWLQFQNENIIHTADFVILVDQGSETSIGKE